MKIPYVFANSVFALAFGGLVLSSCSRDETANTEFFRPPIPLPSDRVDIRLPATSSEKVEKTFDCFTKVEESGSGRVFFHGEVKSRSIPVQAIWSVNVADQTGDIGGGYHIEVELLQVSEWKRTLSEELSKEEGAGLGPLQVHASYRFFHPKGSELLPERALSIFPQANRSEFFPVSRSGSWNHHSHKRQIALWFRIRDKDGFPLTGQDVRGLGVIDQRTGISIPGLGFFGMGKGEYRVKIDTPFWHDGGLDFVLDQFLVSDESHQDFDLVEGAIYEMEGLHVQVLLFRPGTWQFCSLNDQESDLAESPSFARALKKVSDDGLTLMAVTDGDGGLGGQDWKLEAVGAGGEKMRPGQRNGPFFYKVFDETLDRLDQVKPSFLRVTRGPIRDRIVVSLNRISGTSPENEDPANLFNQRVPLFYARSLRGAIGSLSELVGLEKAPEYSPVPRDIEDFSLVLHDVTGHRIAGEIAKHLETVGLGFELNQDSWHWEFPEMARTPDSAVEKSELARGVVSN